MLTSSEQHLNDTPTYTAVKHDLGINPLDFLEHEVRVAAILRKYPSELLNDHHVQPCNQLGCSSPYCW